MKALSRRGPCGPLEKVVRAEEDIWTRPASNIHGATVAGMQTGEGRLGRFYVCVGLLDVAMGVQKSSSQTLLADLVDKHELGEYSFVYALSDIADSLGLVLGPIIGLWLGQVFSYSIGVLSMGMLCLLVAPFVMRIKY